MLYYAIKFISAMLLASFILELGEKLFCKKTSKYGEYPSVYYDGPNDEYNYHHNIWYLCICKPFQLVQKRVYIRRKLDPCTFNTMWQCEHCGKKTFD